MAMSRLFSSVSAITSRTDRYRFPLRTSDSSRGVLVRFAGENTRFSKWKGRSSGPTTEGSFGMVMLTSEDCAKALKPSNSNEKTVLMQFIGLGKRLLNITNRVQFRFHFIIVATVQAWNAMVSGFATNCPYGGLSTREPGRSLFNEMS